MYKRILPLKGIIVNETMLEHYTTAISLKIDPKGEIDALVSLYTRDLGKVIAKAKSMRKIMSKLAGHIVPGNIVNVRLIERGDGNGLQVLDGLSEKPKGDLKDILIFLNFLDKITPSGLPDNGLWHEAVKVLEEGGFSPERYRRMLRVSGFLSDASGYVEKLKCDNCGNGNVCYFIPQEVIFLCANSMRKLNFFENDAIRI